MLLIPDTHHTDITGITDILLNLSDTAVPLGFQRGSQDRELEIAALKL